MLFDERVFLFLENEKMQILHEVVVLKNLWI